MTKALRMCRDHDLARNCAGRNVVELVPHANLIWRIVDRNPGCPENGQTDDKRGAEDGAL